MGSLGRLACGPIIFAYLTARPFFVKKKPEFIPAAVDREWEASRGVGEKP
jgi:hypothetical protein